MADRVALVTGGGSGLGLATTKALAKGGTDICISYHNNEDCAVSACDEIRTMVRRAALVRLEPNTVSRHASQPTATRCIQVPIKGIALPAE